ncbi:hypothetical protein GCM10022243_65560 [Saccharothrix violaceirubra]|uniref:Uncharacterized protein n=1 Tax=Saccharothrix violaceirubra TaxID=413306 RepID=A0A7W7WZ61_9PSEU|nr:hypothetical protein [Saccharothrix violaceirubra]MBB4968957.1 hypothetical protein [Saccharothrix violaceirubra]
MTNDGVALPVRLHDLLLALAGRVDDDALTQARELLAVAELDRAVELLVGCLIAGRIPVSSQERREIADQLVEVRSDPVLADKLFAVEDVPTQRHRFTADSEPDAGLAEVLGKTVSVLPDVRGVRATWRLSPAGGVPGPMPHRVVLVEVGPSGFPPATSYRLDTVLRNAGIRASTEVLTVGTPLGEYHAAAVSAAREVYFPSATPVRVAEESGATWFDGEVRVEAPVVEPEPVPVTEPESGSKSRRARVDSYEGSQPFPPKPVKRLPVREQEEVVSEPVVETVVEEPVVEPVEVEPPVVEPAVVEPLTVESLAVEHPLSRAEVTTELNADDLAVLQAALDEGKPPSSVHLPPTVDAKLSDRERALLQQLHEELAQREQQAWPSGEFVNGVPKPNNGKYPG